MKLDPITEVKLKLDGCTYYRDASMECEYFLIGQHGVCIGELVSMISPDKKQFAVSCEKHLKCGWHWTRYED